MAASAACDYVDDDDGNEIAFRGLKSTTKIVLNIIISPFLASLFLRRSRNDIQASINHFSL